jgi:hypothetical protein
MDDSPVDFWRKFKHYILTLLVVLGYVATQGKRERYSNEDSAKQSQEESEPEPKQRRAEGKRSFPQMSF